MRRIEFSNQFKRDFKREQKGRHRDVLQTDFNFILEVLLADLNLDPKYRDHALIGEWAGFRDCHIKPDLVLIYKKQGADVLLLARLGTHSEVFG